MYRLLIHRDNAPIQSLRHQSPISLSTTAAVLGYNDPHIDAMSISSKNGDIITTMERMPNRISGEVQWAVREYKLESEEFVS